MLRYIVLPIFSLSPKLNISPAPPPHQLYTMGIIRTFLNTAILSGAGAAGGFAFWTRNSIFVPLSPTDAIFSSPAYLRNNPSKNPATQDLCVKKVPLSKIKPQLLEKEGKLIEAFCAGVWSGLGMLLFHGGLSLAGQWMEP